MPYYRCCDLLWYDLDKQLRLLYIIWHSSKTNSTFFKRLNTDLQNVRTWFVFFLYFVLFIRCTCCRSKCCVVFALNPLFFLYIYNLFAESFFFFEDFPSFENFIAMKNGSGKNDVDAIELLYSENSKNSFIEKLYFYILSFTASLLFRKKLFFLIICSGDFSTRFALPLWFWSLR